MEIKDDRIKFCLNVYFNTLSGKNVACKFFEKLPNEVYKAINEYKNVNLKLNNKKYIVIFNKHAFDAKLDTLQITAIDGKKQTSAKIFYTYFNSDLVNEYELNKTIIFYEERIQKGLFTKATQRIFGQYSILNTIGNEGYINFVEDENGKARKYCVTFTNFRSKLKNLKSESYYNNLDKNMAQKCCHEK